MLKVLIVDDEQLTREILIKFIPWYKFGEVLIEEAESGKEGVQIFSTFSPDLVITDLMMPIMDGIEMAKEIRKSCQSCKFIFLTAYTDKEYMKSAIRLKISEYVEKPLQIDEVTLAIEKAVNELNTENAMKESVSTLLSNELCLLLINYNITIETIMKTISKTNLEFTIQGDYITSVFCVYSNSESDTYDEDITDFKSFISILADKFINRCVVAQKGKEFIVIHVKLQNNSNYAEFISLLQQIINDFIRQEKPYGISIGVGEIVHDLDGIKKSYESAVIALKQCFFRKENSINFYSNISSEPYIISIQEINQIANYVKHQELTKGTIATKNLIKELIKHDNTQPEYIKKKMIELILNLLKIAQDLNDSILQNLCTLAMKKIENSPNLFYIENEIIMTIQEFVSKIKLVPDEDLVTNINLFIQNHYENTDFSLNLLANRFRLTVNYLCYIYKKETGKTINQYLTEVRINRAKYLLAETDTKIYNIAKKVGYQEGKYFSKVFLKQVGLKPAEYREKHLDEKSFS